MTTATTTKIETARELGAKAFAAGMKCVPAFDRNLLELLKGNTEIGAGIPVLDAWLASWHRANLAAPVEPQPRDEMIATALGAVRVTQILCAFPRDRRFDDSECPECDSGIGVQMTNGYLTGIEADCECLFDVAMIAKLEAYIERHRHEADAEENGPWGAADRAYDNWKDSRA